MTSVSVGPELPAQPLSLPFPARTRSFILVILCSEWDAFSVCQALLWVGEYR